MPLYEYKCDNCGERFELIQKFSDPPAETCAKCGGGPVHKQMSSPAIQFKGSGWYITDYAKKGSGAAAKTDGGAPSEAAAKSDKSDAKADKKTEKSEPSASPTKPAADPVK